MLRYYNTITGTGETIITFKPGFQPNGLFVSCDKEIDISDLNNLLGLNKPVSVNGEKYFKVVRKSNIWTWQIRLNIKTATTKVFIEVD